MGKKRKSAISPTRQEDYPEWYQQVVQAAELAEISPVRGCMVIKPWGWSIWENMQRILDGMFMGDGPLHAGTTPRIAEAENPDLVHAGLQTNQAVRRRDQGRPTADAGTSRRGHATRRWRSRAPTACGSPARRAG